MTGFHAGYRAVDRRRCLLLTRPAFAASGLVGLGDLASRVSRNKDTLVIVTFDEGFYVMPLSSCITRLLG